MSSIGTRGRDLAAAIASGDRSATDVVREHLEHIDAGEADIRAFNTVVGDRALEAAAAVDRAVADGQPSGPLAGVPISIKDNVVTRDIATTASSGMLRGWIPPYDATVVHRIVDAGGVIIGKTNLDEFAMGSTTETSVFGPTRNPVDRSRVPGGSSGGSAAAVAARFTPLSIGSDTGGSIRQPASHCGIVGIKPTYGRVSRLGLIALGSSLDQIGTFGADVADAAHLLDVITGHDPADATSISDDIDPVVPHLDDGVAGRRIGVIVDLLGDEIHPAVAARVRAAADALADAGAEIVEVSIPSVRHALAAYHLIVNAEASSNLARYDGVRYGLRVDAGTTDEMMAATRTAGFGDAAKLRLLLGTHALSAGRFDELYDRARRVRTLVIAEFRSAGADADLFLAPTTPRTAPVLGEATDPLVGYLDDLCTVPANLAGLPALSIPFGSDAGLPIGVQIIAPALGEAAMLATAAVLESAAPALTEPAPGGNPS